MEALQFVEPDRDLDDLEQDLGHASPEALLSWASRTFGGEIVLTSSFGAHSAVMLHMVTRIMPRIPVILIDTGYLFPETYLFAKELTERFDLNLHVTAPAMTAARQEALYGKLWEQGEEGVRRYLELNKVEPLARALEELRARAWIAGLRSEQTAHRSSLRRVDLLNERYKIHPILHWTAADVQAYVDAHDLPHHPLYAEGYRSVGDWHSTLPTTEDMDPREGRLLGKKRECGIHLTADENASLGSSGL